MFWKMPRMKAASLVAATGGKGRATLLQIIHDERSWIQNHSIEGNKRRESGSIISRLRDEGSGLAVKEYLASAGESVTRQQLAYAINTNWSTGRLPIVNAGVITILPAPALSVMNTTLSSRTASSWLRSLGYSYKEVKKGVYKDGHEREDIISYHQNQFLPTLQALKPFMVSWKQSENGNLEVVMVPPESLPAYQRAIVVVTHDESTFDSNDGRARVWVKDGGAPLRKKSRGKGIMVSDFLFQGGRLRAPHWLPTGDLPNFGLSPESGFILRDDPYMATMKLEYGKNRWWEGEDLVLQVLRVAIPIFESAFPGCQGLFLFDNATSHAAFAPDALLAKRMNLRPGGEQTILHPGAYSHMGHSYVQEMVDPMGVPKGLKTVLQERGLWKRGLRVQCRKPGTEKLLKTCLLRGSQTCCARAIMASQPDFQAQKCRLQEEVERAGHLVLFYPKFHCELNPIEYFWGATKRYTRNNCLYSIKGLRQTIPDALDSVSPSLICKYLMKTERMMDAYREGMAYGTTEFTARMKHVYKSHRRMPEQLQE